MLSPQPHPEDLLAIIVPPAFLVAIDEVWITLLLLRVHRSKHYLLLHSSTNCISTDWIVRVV
jgi:hypothetical protein